MWKANSLCHLFCVQESQLCWPWPFWALKQGRIYQKYKTWCDIFETSILIILYLYLASRWHTPLLWTILSSYLLPTSSLLLSRYFCPYLHLYSCSYFIHSISCWKKMSSNNFNLKRKQILRLTTLQFGLVHHFTKLGSGEYYLEELEHEVIVGML